MERLLLPSGIMVGFRAICYQQMQIEPVAETVKEVEQHGCSSYGKYTHAAIVAVIYSCTAADLMETEALGR